MGHTTVIVFMKKTKSLKTKTKKCLKAFLHFHLNIHTFMVNVPVTIQIYHLPQRRDITCRGKLC